MGNLPYNIYYQPDTGLPTGGALPAQTLGGILDGITEKEKTHNDLYDSLSKTQQQMVDTLDKMILTYEDQEKYFSGMFEGMEGYFESFHKDFDENENLYDALFSNKQGGEEGGSGGGGKKGKGGGLLSGIKPNENPTSKDVAQLPAEYGMGALLIYWKLEDIFELLSNGTDKKTGSEKTKKDKGGGFSGMMKGVGSGANALVALAASMAIFAGALHIFAAIGPKDWGNALIGVGAFSLFVVGAVAIAKTLDAEKKPLEQFSEGVRSLTITMGLFAGMVFLMSFIPPEATAKSLVMVGYFLGFTFLVVALANRINAEEKTLEQFGKTTLIMTASLGLFGLVITGLSLIDLATIAKSLPTVALFAGFATGVALLAKVVNGMGKDLILFSLSTLVLTSTMFLFAKAIEVIAEIPRDDVIYGSIVMAAASVLMAVIGALGYACMTILPGVLLMAATLAAFSGGMILFAEAIKATTEAGEGIDEAMIALPKMLSFLTHSALVMGTMSGTVMLQLAGFGLALVPFSTGFKKFAETIQVVAGVGPQAEAAIPALEQMMLFLSNPDGLRMGENGEMIKGGQPGVLQLIDGVSGWTLLRLGAFGIALKPFSSGFRDFAGVIDEIALVGDKAKEGGDAQTGLQDMMTLMMGTGVEGDKSVRDFLDGVSGGVFRSIKKFGTALSPFSEAMSQFADVVKKIADMKAEIGTADNKGPGLQGMDAVVTFLQEASGMIDGVVNGKFFLGLGKSNIQKFGEQVGPFATALLELTTSFDILKDFNESSSTKILAGFNQLKVVLDGVDFGDEDKDRFENFADSLGDLGRGLREYAEETTEVAGIDQLIGSLEKLANLDFKGMDPLNKFLDAKVGNIEKMAGAFETMAESAAVLANPNSVEETSKSISDRGFKSLDDAVGLIAQVVQSWGQNGITVANMAANGTTNNVMMMNSTSGDEDGVAVNNGAWSGVGVNG